LSNEKIIALSGSCLARVSSKFSRTKLTMVYRGLCIGLTAALLLYAPVHTCPTPCTCRSNTVDCSNTGLKEFPTNIPTDTVKLDLSYNALARLPPGAVDNLPYLRILQLNNNNIQCLDGEAFSSLPQLVSITLQNNNLTTVPESIRNNLPRLQSLRLEHNPLRCDCLLDWILEYDTLATLARCYSPYNLSGKRIAELKKRDFKCSGEPQSPVCSYRDEASQCPPGCKCSDGIVDCRNRGLTAIPSILPADMTEIRLEQNQITEIPARAFCLPPPKENRPEQQRDQVGGR